MANDQALMTEKVLKLVADERSRQREKWGNEHDDNEHTPEDWNWLISRYNGRALNGDEDFQHLMIQVAALAVAAFESYDRKEREAAEDRREDMGLSQD
jgi:hypothetical protein